MIADVDVLLTYHTFILLLYNEDQLSDFLGILIQVDSMFSDWVNHKLLSW